MLPELISGGFFNGIDMVVPVPLHFTKKLSRGYNQCDHIAAAITEATGIESRSILKCRKKHSSQTHRNAFQRWMNVRDTYGIASEAGELNGRHILVVDDVITTGATLLSCCEAIHSAYPLAKISVLSLAITELQ